MDKIVVDQAGSPDGGAGRLRSELVSYVRTNPRSDCEVIGLHTYLTPGWLVEREKLAFHASRKVALNNASFFLPNGYKTVLLQNVIHFSSTDERHAIGYRKPSARIRAQIPIIRAGARFADRIIVPSSEMRRRVLEVMPSTRGRIDVRFLPLTRPAWAGAKPDGCPIILLPQAPQPYKPLDFHIGRLVEALKVANLAATIVCTSTPEELPHSATIPNVKLVGRLSHRELDTWYGRAQAVYFPTTYESFGYPVAEARAGGRWLIGQNTEQNREIAGNSLLGFDVANLDSLAESVSRIGDPQPQPHPEPFDPVRFFDDVIFGNSIA